MFCFSTASPPRRNPGPTSSGLTTCAPTNTSRSKENTLKRSDLDDFVAGYNPKNRHERKESERLKAFGYDELQEESANPPAREVIAAEIAEDLEAAPEQFATIAADLKRALQVN